MNKERPLIMISNDDGYTAKGLYHLIDCINASGINAEIIAVAPQGHSSGMSSAITVDKAMRLVEQADYNGAKIYYVTGTPVDCVKLGFHAAMPRRPDLMLSGINHGSNAGNSLIYSGTMGAAMEACMIGIPAIGYSLLNHASDADFSGTTELIQKITRTVLEKGLPKGICLNVNFPANCTPKGIKVTKSAPGRWTEEYKRYEDPHGRPFYFLTGHYINEAPDDESTDMYWLDREWATITPVQPDQTAFGEIPALKKLFDWAE
ncbi:MAG: 5'/3'-nucleotidase SurE [Muribaculaceae bacterium]|nr:5'/3'-nucleotidase SurE [Muribaculaceae bacterium]